MRQTVCVKRYESVFDGMDAFKIQRAQFPLVPAYALTIHKAQGVTLAAAQVFLDSCFTDAQAYVALSRLQTLDGLYLRTFEPAMLSAPGEVGAEMDRLRTMTADLPTSEFGEAVGWPLELSGDEGVMCARVRGFVASLQQPAEGGAGSDSDNRNLLAALPAVLWDERFSSLQSSPTSTHAHWPPRQ